MSSRTLQTQVDASFVLRWDMGIDLNTRDVVVECPMLGKEFRFPKLATKEGYLTSEGRDEIDEALLDSYYRELEGWCDP